MEKINKIGHLNYVKRRENRSASVKTKLLENDGNLDKDIKPGPQWIGMILSVRSSVWTNAFDTAIKTTIKTLHRTLFVVITDWQIILQKYQKDEEHLENDILLL